MSQSSTPIEYFYSTHSAFAYLGSQLFRDISAGASRPVRYVPFDLRRLFKALNRSPNGSQSDAHRAYFFGRELTRWAQYRGIEMLPKIPTHHDHDLAQSSRLIIAAQQQGIDVGELTHVMLSAHWIDDADLDDSATLVKIANDAGLDGQALIEAQKDPEIDKAYVANTDEAIERQIFGSPTYVVDGDVFYGQDRLELVKRALTQPFD
jgi:2-hydroxychromene-2-carboxylate isomerase